MVRVRDSLSIIELERLLGAKKSAIAKLQKKRLEVQKKLDAIDQEITALGGVSPASANQTPGGRIRNSVSLVAALESVLKGKPGMKVGDILAGVLATGYQSTSDNFRAIVNQTLIKEKQFHSVSRGVYAMK